MRISQSLTLASVLLISGCAKPYVPAPVLLRMPVAPHDYPSVAIPADKQADIERAVRAELKDPESAQFGAMVAFQRPNRTVFVCGLVNARNSFGGYAGYAPFAVDPAFSPIVDVSDVSGEGRGMFTDDHPECAAFARTH